MTDWLIKIVSSRFFRVAFIILTVIGIVILGIIFLAPYLLIIFGHPAPGGGGGENCDPRFFSGTNAC